MDLPTAGTNVGELKCPKCEKTMGECPPDKCEDPDCPQRPKPVN